MTVVMYKGELSRLGKMIDLPGGLTVKEALRRAEASLSPLRASAVAQIGDHIVELETLDGGPGDLERVYAIGSAIIDCGSLFDLGELCAVAAGLCDLAHDAAATRPFDWRMPALHARTLCLLLALPSEAQEERQQLQDEIAAIVARKRASGR